MIKKAIISLLFILITFTTYAQTTKVKGRVTDAATGEGIPFVGIFFKDTQIGVSTDLDGYYTLETRDNNAKILCALILGYDPDYVTIKQHAFNEVNFKLNVTHNSITAATVKPDNRYMKWIMRQINEHKQFNNPENIPYYDCSIYNKMEIDLTNPRDNIKNKFFIKNFGFVFDYIDTSVVSGTPYLPVMISETVAQRYHSSAPTIDKENIEASKISGLNSNNTIAQFTGSMHFKTNFYNNFINAFNVEIPSPIAYSGDLYYNYFLIDSLQIDNRKTYKIRFHPKKHISTPSFDGEMAIDAKDWAIKEIHVKLPKGTNVNWIRDLVIDIENEKIGDSVWFYKTNKIYVDFSVSLKDSSKLASFIGHRNMTYYNPNFTKHANNFIDNESGYNTIIEEGARERGDKYWEQIRPYKLTDKEKNIYKMVEEVKEVPIYKDIYTIINTFMTGYYDVGKLSFGPYSSITSYNNLEGRRFQLGIRTTKDFSRKVRFSTFMAYGLLDKRWKGGLEIEYMFSALPTKKLSTEIKTDVTQLGNGVSAFSETNVLSSLLSKGGGAFTKKSRIDKFLISYEHEFNSNISNTISFELNKIYSNNIVPFYTKDSTIINSVNNNALKYSARFSWKEAVTRGAFDKQHIYTKYPVLTFDISGSLKGIGKNNYSFIRTEASIIYNLALPPIGISYIKFNSGTIFGQVPYPFLKLFEGNSSYFLNKTAFACMDYYEFAADSWATLFYEHNFGGFILGKIPLIKHLKLREVFSVKFAYGTLTDKNNGIMKSKQDAILLFPQGMTTLNKPYIEMGTGITNIMRLFRVDFYWRMTHKHHIVNGESVKVPHLFALNFGIELKF